MKASNSSLDQGPFLLTLGVALLLAVSACEEAEGVDEASQGDAGEAIDNDNWRLVQAYLDRERAWHARDEEIRRSDVSLGEKERMREKRGEYPDIVPAVAAARKLAAGDGMRALDAARFLIEETSGRSPTEAGDKEVGHAALIRLIGSDWSAIEAYNEAYAAWQEDEGKRREEFRSAGKPFQYNLPPESLEAVAAGQAIVHAGPGHEHVTEAVAFLINLPEWHPDVVLSVAQALANNFPEYDEWPRLLAALDRRRLGRTAEAITEFLVEMAANANDPPVRATARYFAAKGLAESLNDPSIDVADRDSRRQQALAMATGLSEGVETEPFVIERYVDGENQSKTLAEVEAMVLDGIRHGTVGATVADVAGRRLDGTYEGLSAYAGQVILMDFWATWCGPCVAANPRKRELAERYSGEPFTILGISVDDEAQTVIDFMEDEPMPWAHWHIGAGSDLEISWRIAGYPTYVLIGRDGVILARDNTLDTVVNAIEPAFDGGADKR